MKHPRRNEVYRDVGSEPRTPDDPDFVEIYHVPFTKRDALLLCSDGLSDVLPKQRLASVVESHAGDPATALRSLVAEAVAIGRDNVSAILVEGEDFAKPATIVETIPEPRPRRNLLPLWVALALIIGFASGYLASVFLTTGPHVNRVLHVGKGGITTVPEAVMRAEVGDIIDVGPGEYPERVVLKDGTHITGTDSAHITGGITANELQHASVEGVTASSIDIQDSQVDLDNVSVPGSISFRGASTGSLRHSRVKKIEVAETAKPALEGNSIEPGR